MPNAILNILNCHTFKGGRDQFAGLHLLVGCKCPELCLLIFTLHNRENHLDRIPIRKVGSVEGPLEAVSGHPVLGEGAGVHAQVVQDQHDLSITDLLPQLDQELLELEPVDAAIELVNVIDSTRGTDRSDHGDRLLVRFLVIEIHWTAFDRPGSLHVGR